MTRSQTRGDAPLDTARVRESKTVRSADDPLGYDTRDFDAAVKQMIHDVKSGRTKEAVARELEKVRRTFQTFRKDG
jgi:hypothetical protein